MNFLNTLAILITIAGGILGFLQTNLSERVMRIAGPTCLALALCAALLIYFGSMSTPQITITSYTNDQLVKDFVKISPDGQIEIYPVQFVTNYKLKASEEVVLFMRVAGGDAWWIPGSPVKSINIQKSGVGQIDSVTIGSQGDGNIRYELILAVIQEKEYRSGVNLSKLPIEQIICSDQIFLEKGL